MTPLRFEPLQDDDGGPTIDHVSGEVSVRSDHPSLAIHVSDESTEGPRFFLRHEASLP